MKKKIAKFFITLSALLVSLPSVDNFESNINVAKASSNIYHVPVELWHAENSGRLSMGNNAVGTIARVEETNNGSIITVEFMPMEFMNMNGHLYSLSVYSGNLFSGSLTSASVISTYQDHNLDGQISNFPALLQFQRSNKREDKIGVRVSVDAMDKVLGADAAQNAILKFNWASASLISGEQKDTVEEKNSEEKNVDSKKEKEEEKNKDRDKNNDKNPQEKKSEENKTENKPTKQLSDFFKEDTKTIKAGLYNIDITAAYLNPLTGVTADGGTKNVDIGEGMSQGVISPITTDVTDLSSALKNQKAGGEKRWSKAQLQRTKDGKLYATVRIHLMNWVTRNKEQGPFIKVLQENGEYTLVESLEENVHIEKFKDSYADYRFEVPKENFSAMIQMFVEPMNRPVRFFVEVNPETIKEGGVEGMNSKEDNNTDNKKIIFFIGSILLMLVLGLLAKKKNNKKPKEENV